MELKTHSSQVQKPVVLSSKETSVSSLLAALKSSRTRKDLKAGKSVHAEAVHTGKLSNIYVASSLVDMYVKCGSLPDARQVFERMTARNVVSWTSLMLGYAQKGEGSVALSLFQRMLRESCEPDCQTYVALFKACASLAQTEQGRFIGGKVVKLLALEKGLALHSQAATSGYDSDIYVGSSLVDMYSRCGVMEDASRLFFSLPRHNVVIWTALMTGYSQNGEGERALELFAWMKSQRCQPNELTFVTVLKACASSAAKEDGRKQPDGKFVKLVSLERAMLLHNQAVNSRCEDDIFVSNTLVDLYSKCGSMRDARRVFDGMARRNAVSWTAIMLGYTQEGEGQTALDLFSRMRHETCDLDGQIFVAALKGCTTLAVKEENIEIEERLVKAVALEAGMVVHVQAAKHGYETDVFVASSLVDMYAHCGSLTDAERVFQTISAHNVVTWSAMMLAYAQNGETETALEVFSRMKSQSCQPDEKTYASALKVCAGIASLEFGKAIHRDVCRVGTEVSSMISNSLLDLYGKNGTMIHAQVIFDAAVRPDIVAWNALLSGYSRQGDTARVFRLFEGMVKERVVPPDGITFLVVLTACSHAGVVEQGRRYFKAMHGRFGLVPGAEHYHCIVDMLGRANQLQSAVEIVKSMPSEPTAMTWLTVLGACWKWKNLEVAEAAFDAVVRIDERNTAAYLLMANIYEELSAQS